MSFGRRALDCACHSLCCWRQATGCAEGFVSCLQVHRGGWVHLSVVLLSAFCVDGIPACIRFPSSSCVYLFYMFSIVVTYRLLFYIHVYFVRHKEHIRYIRTNNPLSAYALHVLQNRHEYGTIDDTLQLLKTCRKDTRMNRWETLYMQVFHQHKMLITDKR